MDTDEIAAKELKRRKDFSLSASTASPLSTFSHQSSTLVTGVRCRIWSLNNQLSTLSFSFNRRWTRMDADEIAARERKGRKDFSLSASTAFPRSTFNHQPSTFVTRVRCRILPSSFDPADRP